MAKVLLYHPFGNQNVKGVLNALFHANMLHSFHLCIAVFKGTLIYSVLNFLRLNKFFRREYDVKFKAKTICYPFLELLRHTGIPEKINKHFSAKVNISTTHKVAKYVSNNIDEIDGAYCYGFGALEVFKVLSERHKTCILEVPTAYYKEISRIIKKEETDNPEWAQLLSYYKETDTMKRLDEELKLSDIIIVPSTYSKRTLTDSGYNADDIYVIPYGFPSVNRKKYRTINGAIKILYVGGLSQLKGISYLFEACDMLKDKVELNIIGGGNLSDPKLSQYLKKCNYLGTMPHDNVLIEMRNADILVFPTLSDGFGMVASEAMSQGTPVIASLNSCGPDIIKDSYNGWLIEPGSTELLYTKLLYIYNNKQIISEIGKNALTTALERPWNCYYQDIIRCIESHA